MKKNLIVLSYILSFSGIALSQDIKPIKFETHETPNLDETILYSEFDNLFDEFIESCYSRRIGSRSPFINLLVNAMEKSGSTYSRKAKRRSDKKCLNYIEKDISFTFEHYYRHYCGLTFIDDPDDLTYTINKGESVAEVYFNDFSEACENTGNKSNIWFNEWSTALNVWGELLAEKVKNDFEQKAIAQEEKRLQELEAKKKAEEEAQIAELKRQKEREERKLRLIAEAKKAEVEKQKLLAEQQKTELEREKLLIEQKKVELESQKLAENTASDQPNTNLSNNSEVNNATNAQQSTNKESAPASINDFKDALGFKEVKIGMSKKQIMDLGVCEVIVPSLGIYNCYDRLVNLYGSAFQTPLFEDENLVQIYLSLDEFDEEKYIKYDRLLSEKYEVNSRITEKELDQLTFHQKDKIFNVYEKGKVLLELFRGEDGIVLLGIIYSDDDTAGMYYSKPKKKLTIDDI